jgi:hypothetical protein
MIRIEAPRTLHYRRNAAAPAGVRRLSGALRAWAKFRTRIRKEGDLVESAMRFWAALILLALGCGVAAAEPERGGTPAALGAVYQCAAITGEQERLACYDAAVTRLRDAETQGDVVAVDRQQADQVRRESFGLSLPGLVNIFQGNGRHFEPIDNVQMQVTRVAAAGAGRNRFVMSNGQTWVQVEAQDAHNVRAGDTITIHSGAFGSYFLTPARGGQGHRVRREE